MYILRPRAAGILHAPPFYTPPAPRRVFSGVGGWGCIKSGPVISFSHSCLASFFFKVAGDTGEAQAEVKLGSGVKSEETVQHEVARGAPICGMVERLE